MLASMGMMEYGVVWVKEHFLLIPYLKSSESCQSGQEDSKAEELKDQCGLHTEGV